MPYVTKQRRRELKRVKPMSHPGDLNYEITALMDKYIQGVGLSYQTINNLVGALDCAKMELYRRIAAPYEDIKIRENGDVYTCPRSTI